MSAEPTCLVCANARLGRRGTKGSAGDFVAAFAGGALFLGLAMSGLSLARSPGDGPRRDSSLPPGAFHELPAKPARLAGDFVGPAVTGADSKNREEKADDIRCNATVRAVHKVKASVVAVKVTRRAGGGRTREAVGTGLIVDERGYVVTNSHVVAGCVRLSARLVDGTEVAAHLIHSDPATDLAILRLRTQHKLIAQPLAASLDVEEGEDVIAIGHPLGYSYTISKGIVSALNREVEMPTGYTLTGLIQTDTPINPGNSGGPLLNIKGEVIGINVAYNQEAQGIAFAISAATVRRVLGTQLSGPQAPEDDPVLTSAEEPAGAAGEPRVGDMASSHRGAETKATCSRPGPL
jgi:S1-C subfamily serine protease